MALLLLLLSVCFFFTDAEKWPTTQNEHKYVTVKRAALNTMSTLDKLNKPIKFDKHVRKAPDSLTFLDQNQEHEHYYWKRQTPNSNLEEYSGAYAEKENCAFMPLIHGHLRRQCCIVCEVPPSTYTRHEGWRIFRNDIHSERAMRTWSSYCALPRNRAMCPLRGARGGLSDTIVVPLSRPSSALASSPSQHLPSDTTATVSFGQQSAMTFNADSNHYNNSNCGMMEDPLLSSVPSMVPCSALLSNNNAAQTTTKATMGINTTVPTNTCAANDIVDAQFKCRQIAFDHTNDNDRVVAHIYTGDWDLLELADLADALKRYVCETYGSARKRKNYEASAQLPLAVRVNITFES